MTLSSVQIINDVQIYMASNNIATHITIKHTIKNTLKDLYINVNGYGGAHDTVRNEIISANYINIEGEKTPIQVLIRGNKNHPTFNP